MWSLPSIASKARFLYDLADLERMASEGRAGRELAARQAWSIVDEEVAAYQKNRAARAATPAIALLRAQFEALRAEALKEAGGDAEKATHLLINRLLHAPVGNDARSCGGRRRLG